MYIVGVGGTLRGSSTTQTALQVALDSAASHGATTALFGAAELNLPLYDPSRPTLSRAAEVLVKALRDADGVILASPGYHGTISGVVKNALDYAEELAHDERPYLSELPVGCIAVAYGWHAAVNTLGTLRGIVHTLRGWPTPYGAAINASTGNLSGGKCSDDEVRAGLQLVGTQVVSLAGRPPLAPLEVGAMSAGGAGHIKGETA